MHEKVRINFDLYLLIELEMVMNLKWTTWQRRIKSRTSFNSWISRIPNGSTLFFSDLTDYFSQIWIFQFNLHHHHHHFSSLLDYQRSSWQIDVFHRRILDSSFDLSQVFLFSFFRNLISVSHCHFVHFAN